MKMRELEDRTGVNREVIRIMIRKGLLPPPRRPARNAAEYDDQHVRGVLAVRALQQHSRLTLKEIEGAVERGQLEHASPTSAYPYLETLLSARFGLRDATLVSLSSFASDYPDAERDARAFAAMGMLDLVEVDAELKLSPADLRLVEIWGRIREAGFVEEAGYPPENIAFYLDAAQRVAAHEAQVFFEKGSGDIDEDRAAAMLHIALPLMLDFFGLLRIKAFLNEVHDRLSSDRK